MAAGDLHVLPDTLSTVRAVVQRFLSDTGAGVEVVDPDRHLTEYAVSSVQLLQLHARLEDAFGVEIPAVALFDHDSVAAFADYLAGRR